MEIDRQLQQRMARLGIRDADLRESFIRGSGPGGQKINKTSSCVRLKHPASGVEVRCQQERSLTQNRLLARNELCAILEERRRVRARRERDRIEKRRRRERPRPRGLKRRILEAKRRRGFTKKLRRRPGGED